MKKNLESQAKKVINDVGEGTYEAKDGVKSGKRRLGPWETGLSLLRCDHF